MFQSRSNINEKPKIIKASNQDFTIISQVIARAFNNDPFLNWLVLQDTNREKRFIRAFEACIYLATHNGLIYTTSEHRGSAIWFPPGKWNFGLFRQILVLPKLIKITGLRAAIRKLKGMKFIERKHPSKPHYYLFVLGTDPHFQRKGIGSALLKPILQICDKERIPAYLETSNEKNLAFYEQCGFKTSESIWMPFSGPKIWLMWREPMDK